MRADDLIKSPKEAINVFDFEPVCRKNVPPAHFGYMASGIDDEVTLRANREGFLKFQLRPRRLVDVSKVDMSVDILGTKYDSPIVCAPVGGQRSFHDDGEAGVATRRQGRRSPADPVDHDQHRRRGRHQGARRADLDAALRHQQVGGGGRPSSSAPRTPAARRSPSRSIAPAAATRKRCSGCGAPTPAIATAATTAAACRRACGPARCRRASTSPGCATPSRPP